MNLEQQYADQYANEQMLSERAANLRQLRAQWQTHRMFLGAEALAMVGALGIDIDSTEKLIDETCSRADWLAAEAKWNRLRSEALLQLRRTD